MKQENKGIISPKEKAEQILLMLAGWTPSSVDKLAAMELCQEMADKSESQEDKDYWNDTITEIYMHGREFN